MFVVFFFAEVYNTLKLSGEWVWILYISIVIVSGILGVLVAQYFSNPFNLFLRERYKRLVVMSTKASLTDKNGG